MYKKLRVVIPLAITLALGMPGMVYAQSEEEAGQTETVSIEGEAGQTETEVGIESEAGEGNAFTEDGNATLGDTATSADNKEFITVTTKNGNTFYLIIDRERDSDNVYFLNMVDERDLEAFLEETESEELDSILSLPEETETEEKSDITSEELPEDEELPEEEQDDLTEQNNKLYIIFIVCVAVIVIVYFKKFRKGKHTDEDEYETEDEYEDDGEVIYSEDEFEDRKEPEEFDEDEDDDADEEEVVKDIDLDFEEDEEEF